MKTVGVARAKSKASVDKILTAMDEMLGRSLYNMIKSKRIADSFTDSFTDSMTDRYYGKSVGLMMGMLAIQTNDHGRLGNNLQVYELVQNERTGWN